MMDSKQVLSAVSAEIARAESFMENRIARERALAYDYYYGREFGNEVEGRSRVVSCDVAQAVDAAVPPIVEIFVSGDKAVEFAPRNQEDVESAEQATDSANYVFFTQNNGYALAHDFIKDGLLQKTGAFKWKWDTSVTMSEKQYEGLDDGTFQILGGNPDVEIVAHEEFPDPNYQPQPSQPGQPPQEPPKLHNVTVRIKKEAGKVRVMVPPPEEILISPDAMTLEVMDMPFICHQPLLTESDLVEMGIDPKVIETLPKGDDNPTEPERVARADRNDGGAVLGEDDAERSQPFYRYDECYIRLDEDGDGIAELRKICKVGSVILHDEPTDHIPIAIWTPKVMPHEVVGISLADDVMDIQLLKSTLWRGINDSLYQSIAPRLFVKGEVNMDDVLTVKPGGVIRGQANSEVVPITVPFVGQQAFTMLEYSDQEKDARVGFSAMGPGMDPDSINKTATFVREMTNQTNARAKLIARNAAEFGFKPLFRGILYLLAKHQQQALMVRLNNKFVPVDPETWNKEYDMTCNVGLGMGSKEQQLMQLQALGMDLQAIAQTPFAPLLLTPQKTFNYFEKKANLAGFKDATIFVNNPVGPDGQPMQAPPPPKPEAVQTAEINAQVTMQKAQMDNQAKAQAEQLKAQGEVQKISAQAQTDQVQAVNQLQIEREKLASQMAFEREKLMAELQFEREKFHMELQARREEAEMNARVALHKPEQNQGQRT